MAIALEVIQSHPSHEILDSSKISTYMRCPRQYFYEYILGWRSEFPNNHLIFGSAWHLATEILTIGEYSQESFKDACLAFMRFYRHHFPAESDAMFEPKTPANAVTALMNYARRFQQDVNAFKVLGTEIGGLVIVSDNNTVHFKLDVLAQEFATGKFLYLDQKTSQRYYDDWGDHWVLSMQMNAYLHTLYCMYPYDQVKGGTVRSTFFYKQSGRNPKELFSEEKEIKRSKVQMVEWLGEVNHYIDGIKHESRRLAEEDTDHSIMKAFPRNTTACHDFGRPCAYLDFCKTWSNPLARCERAPLGMKVEYWDPREAEEIREHKDLVEMK